ncbi:probable cytosolic oligopeptidase A [Cryptomeria japonica]|uniref:probable cytosolic oligopeptidase A n=1 Tax=Cryptomeria japonica TaxID=3369 RepID=UPI0027DA575D|nr:probable cytosolic oligopeptidase A [Cryptomeria japonica]
MTVVITSLRLSRLISPKPGSVSCAPFLRSNRRHNHTLVLCSKKKSFIFGSVFSSQKNSVGVESKRFSICDNHRKVASMAEEAGNPLLEQGPFPRFDAVEAKHVLPGIRAVLKQLENDLAELESSVEPAWPRLVEPLEKIVDRISVVWGVVNHLKAVKDSEELRSAVEEVQPEKVAFQLRLGQSKPIYNAFKGLKEGPNWETLSEAQKRIVEVEIKEAILNGVALEGDAKTQFNEVQQELEKLSLKFGENVLDATKRFEKLITDKKDIEGLPPTALGLAAQSAKSKGQEGATAEDGPWIITLDIPSYLPVMQHVRNRGLREELYRAFITRASSGDLDNTPVIDRILKLRAEKSKLLGYKNYAEVSMAMKMASVEKAEELLERLRSASWDSAVQDLEDLKIFAKEQGAEEANDMCHWDVNFWSERLREAKYDINEEELRPFFSLPKVLDGLFGLAKMLFDIDIEPADGLAPVWNKDVRFYAVKDSSGSPVAYFYFDPYSRPSEKRGGAWMDEVFGRSRVLAQDGSSVRLPIAHMVCNQTPPVGDEPSLMTFREVETVFHEFGHALQHMLTKQDEGLVAGIRGVEWDAVELPSQFMENWCYHRDTLMGIAKHYKTGETLSESIYSKLVAARTFRAASQNLRQIRFASIDLELHSKYVPGGSETIYDVDRRVGQQTQVVPPLPEDRFLCSFNHIFAGGYEAGYYSYKWAEVLSADAFSAFEEAGLDNEKAVKETGRRFRDTILALGGGRPPLQVFIDFRGREPSTDALLRHNGLLRTPVAA